MLAPLCPYGEALLTSPSLQIPISMAPNGHDPNKADNQRLWANASCLWGHYEMCHEKTDLKVCFLVMWGHYVNVTA